MLALRDDASRMKQLIVLFFLLSVFYCCPKTQAKVILTHAQTMLVDSTYDSSIRSSMKKRLEHFSRSMRPETNRVIGQNTRLLVAKLPESPLSNFIADQLLIYAQHYTSNPVALSLINVSSMRTSLPAGAVTIGALYKILPFDNTVVLLKIKGSDLEAVLNKVAQRGGEGVSNIRMDVVDGKVATLLVAGVKIEKEGLYWIVTTDYLAAGNSGMSLLKKALDKMETHQKVRNVVIEQVEHITECGQSIEGKVDGRIRILKNVNQ